MKLRKLFVGCALVFAIILSNSRIDNKFVLRKEIVSADASGTWKKSNDGRWWFAYSSGGYAVGWEIIGGKWHHFNSSGWMETGWLELEGKWYYLDSSGVMETGWLYLGDKTYYLFGTGEMAVGVTVINKIECFFDGDGELSQNDKAWSVGINYADFSLSNFFPIDTTRDAVEAYNFYKQMGYDADCHTLPTYEVLSSKASNNMPRLSSAIQMYSGHGSSEGMIFYSNELLGAKCKTGIRRKNSKSVKGFDFVRLSEEDMKNVRLIVFAGCNTANGFYNIASEAYERGAKTLIGYTVSVVDGRISVFKNDEKFDINENNTVEKDSKTNIENKLRSKSLGEYKIINSECIYQDGKFYTLHSVEHSINNSKMVLDIYEKE